jgi:5-methylcytosine-specific restriction endonuclease McrA
MKFSDSVRKFSDKYTSIVRRIDAYIDIKHLVVTLHDQYKIPSFQRIINDSKVNEIMRVQEENVRKRGNFSIFQNLIFVELNATNDKTGYLIEGQHRFSAFQRLYYEGFRNQLIPITIIQCNSHQEMKEIFLEINQNTEMPEYILNDFEEKPLVDQIFNYFYNAYPRVWKSTKSPQRPFMKDSHFQDAIAYLIKQFQAYNLEVPNLIELIELEHEYIQSLELLPYLSSKSKNPEKIISKCRDMRCYLGLFPNYNAEWKYKWARDCFIRATNIQPPEEKITRKLKQYRRKKTIPSSLKTAIWKKYIGADKGVYPCWCCEDAEMDKREFHAGHVIPESKGGPSSIENLRPVCASCNLSMGDRHMMDFIRDYFPARYAVLTAETQDKETFIFEI